MKRIACVGDSITWGFTIVNRRAARAEDLAEHGGRPVSFRTAFHKSKKVYDRKRLKRAGIHSDDLSFFFA